MREIGPGQYVACHYPVGAPEAPADADYAPPATVG